MTLSHESSLSLEVVQQNLESYYSMQKTIKGVLCQDRGHSERNLFKRGSIILVFIAHLSLSYGVKIMGICHLRASKGLWLYHRVCPKVLGRCILTLF